jgi:hypothetical protein
MNDCVDFVLARIAEREATARRAGTEAWRNRSIWRHPESPQYIYRDDENIATVSHAYGPHIAAWNPARVLAICEAHKQIVTSHRPTLTVRARVEGDTYMSCPVCEPYPPLESLDPGPCETIRLLAMFDADHPDYREEWKP